VTAPAPADLVIRGGLVLSGPDWLPVRGDVAVRNGRITDVAPELNVAARRVVDAGDAVVLPGMVNAHMHECLERGVFENLPFDRWLHDFALPKDKAYEPRHQRAAALLNQLEMIRNGTTTFIDIFRHPDAAAEVAVASGLRATLSPQVIDHPAGAGETLAGTLAFMDRWADRHPRVRTWFGPHALYSCEPETFRAMSRLASERGAGIHTHISESRTEVADVWAAHGQSPIARLDELLGPVDHVVVAHAVHLRPGDLERLATRGWAVAHCPTSNLKLGNGVAEVATMRAAGVTVGLGTDSIMTNNTLDPWEEMRQAALVSTLAGEDTTALSCRDVLSMATSGSARALGLDSEIGTIEAGRRADLIVVDLNRPHLWPLLADSPDQLVHHLVYAATGADVRTTIVEGAVLMEDRQVATIEAGMVRELAGSALLDLLTRAGVLDG
jgi:5-methylthioadenosine/S-adenosylhomocysteine deaminase